MKAADWKVGPQTKRVTVKLTDEDVGHMEAIRREGLGRRGSVRLAMSYADTIRYALAAAAAGTAMMIGHGGAS